MDWNKLLNDSRLRKSTRVKDVRNEFESDLGRIIFSPAIRRMHDKTQVFPLETDDNIHTRLTHSLEVQSIAYSIGLRLCGNKKFISKFNKRNQSKLLRSIPNILSCIGLAHDIGNPPFGHYGEHIISNYFIRLFSDKLPINSKVKFSLSENEKKDFTKFNGNAQGFRVLSKLQVKQDIYGLNLTIGVLSAFLKYPQLAEEIIETKDYRKTLGVYQSEKDFIKQIRRKIGLNSTKNPLSFLLESADSICYHTMDIEDGFNKGYYKIEEIFEFLKRNTNKDVNKKLNDFNKYFDKKYNVKVNLERTKMVDFRLFIINNLLDEVLLNFFNNLDKIEKGEYYGELIYDNKRGLGKALKKFEFEKIFIQREVESMELAGKSVLEGLLDHFVFTFLNHKYKADEFAPEARRLFNIISRSMKSIIEIETNSDEFYLLNDYYKLRLIVDYVSGMTDKFALKLYQKLSGIRIS